MWPLPCQRDWEVSQDWSESARGGMLAVLFWEIFEFLGSLIYERIKYQVVEGIFKLSANLVRECSRGWSIALEFWKADFNASFGRELCQGCSAWLLTQPSSPKLVVPCMSAVHRTCCSGGKWPASCRGYYFQPSGFLCGRSSGVAYSMCKQGYLKLVSKWYCKYWQTPLKCFTLVKEKRNSYTVAPLLLIINKWANVKSNTLREGFSTYSYFSSRHLCILFPFTLYEWTEQVNASGGMFGPIL